MSTYPNEVTYFHFYFKPRGKIIMFSNIMPGAAIFSVLVLPHQQGGCGCTKTWEGTQLGWLIPMDPGDLMTHILRKASSEIQV